MLSVKCTHNTDITNSIKIISFIVTIYIIQESDLNNFIRVYYVNICLFMYIRVCIYIYIIQGQSQIKYV